MGKKKVRLIKDIFLNWIKTKAINYVIENINLPNNVVMVINVINNLDNLSIIQLLTVKLGVYRFVIYAIYLAFIA